VKKIISLFQRNYETDRLVRDEIVPGAEWVVNGEGIATRKYDGTACLVLNGLLYKRYDAKKGKKPPEDFIAAQPEPDPLTGHWPGWLVIGEGPGDKWHREAWHAGRLDDWTYELVGPKVQGNAERYEKHTLVRHGGFTWASGDDGTGDAVPRTFNEIRDFLSEMGVEGIVWWRYLSDIDCDKVKIKARDFGLPWPPRRAV
jgi:hypothetical protein